MLPHRSHHSDHFDSAKQKEDQMYDLHVNDKVHFHLIHTSGWYLFEVDGSIHA